MVSLVTIRSLWSDMWLAVPMELPKQWLHGQLVQAIEAKSQSGASESNLPAGTRRLGQGDDTEPCDTLALSRAKAITC